MDIDPTLQGRLLGDLLDEEMRAGDGVRVTADLEALPASIAAAQVVAHCTRSSLSDVLPELLACVGLGLNVVTTCEELSYPWSEAPAEANTLHQACLAAGVTVLSAGVNPGFAMDYLPIVLSAASGRVDTVRVYRRQDAGSRRIPLQRKVGVGLEVAQFNTLIAEGRLGHIGLRQSAHALASTFGWPIADIEEAIEPVVATRDTATALGTVNAGQVLGLKQVLGVGPPGAEYIILDLEMAVGLSEPKDEIYLGGKPDLHLIVPGGLHGDSATAALVVNSLPHVVDAPPGVITMADIASIHPW
ncbi:MAG: NAD(P)H-dependent amine dehydrogenase family protein [Candidatus Dormibacteraceae bacterium]